MALSFLDSTRPVKLPAGTRAGLVRVRRTHGAHMFCGMPWIAAGSEPCQYLRTHKSCHSTIGSSIAGVDPPRPLGALTRPPESRHSLVSLFWQRAPAHLAGRTVEEPDTNSLLRRLHVVAHHRHGHFEAAGGRREAVSYREPSARRTPRPARSGSTRPARAFSSRRAASTS